MSLASLPLMPWWVVHAPCAQVGPDLFYSGDGNGRDAMYVHRARRICAGCPYKAPCALWAIQNDEQFGIWGGLSPAQRRKVAAELAAEDVA
jgi:WhiB family redox-sensing transcriptional regulator